MVPFYVPPPPVQTARLTLAPAALGSIATRMKVISPMAPTPSRIDPRPVVLDRWGHFTGLGAETDRVQVRDPGWMSGLALPAACGILAFILVSSFLKS